MSIPLMRLLLLAAAAFADKIADEARERRFRAEAQVNAFEAQLGLLEEERVHLMSRIEVMNRQADSQHKTVCGVVEQTLLLEERLSDLEAALSQKNAQIRSLLAARTGLDE